MEEAVSDCPHYVNRYGTCEICHAYKPNEALDAERASHLATRQELSAALARAAELEREAVLLARAKSEAWTRCETATRERDAALARVAELESLLQAAHDYRAGPTWDDHRERVMGLEAEVERITRERDEARAQVEAHRTAARHAEDRQHAAEADAARLRAALTWCEANWKKVARVRGEGLPMIRAALTGSPVETKGEP